MGTKEEKMETIRACLEGMQDIHSLLDNFDLASKLRPELLAAIAEAAGMRVHYDGEGRPHGCLQIINPTTEKSPRTNADWAAEQIRKHGVDRYPTIERQFIKLVEEMGELSKEVNKTGDLDPKQKKLRREAADVALALYNLAAKLEFDLDVEIRSKVKGDERKFV